MIIWWQVLSEWPVSFYPAWQSLSMFGVNLAKLQDIWSTRAQVLSCGMAHAKLIAYDTMRARHGDWQSSIKKKPPSFHSSTWWITSQSAVKWEKQSIHHGAITIDCSGSDTWRIDASNRITWFSIDNNILFTYDDYK